MGVKVGCWLVVSSARTDGLGEFGRWRRIRSAAMALAAEAAMRELRARGRPCEIPGAGKGIKPYLRVAGRV